MEADGELISLNVRTIDQRTFPVSIRSGASVPQLKAAVAEETGVTLARQRLIFRGRVLKNDQPLSAYALEDGHTLHLVVRAEPVVDVAAPAQAAAAQAPAQGGAGRPAARVRGSAGSRSARFLRAISRGRDNDEPDPMMAAGTPNRVLMGATITVPEGSDVNMPFLSSMIANIMNSVQDTVAGGGGVAVDDTEAGRGIRRVTWTPDARAASRTRHRVSSRSRRDRSDRTAHAGSAAAGGQPGSGAPPQPVDRQVTLRARTALRLQNIQQTLENQEFDFQGVEHRQVDANVNSDASAFQAQLDQFVTLITQFNPRMQLLPVALSDNESLQDQTQNEQLVRSVVRAIETLQTIGESADLLSRVARHLFLRQSSRALEHLSRLDEGRRSRMWQSVSRSATERGADVGAPSAAPAPVPAQSAPAAPTENTASPDEPSNVAPNPPDFDQAPEVQQQGPQSMLPPFLQTLLAGSRSFPVDLTGGQGLASAVGSTGEASTGAAGPVPAGPPRAHGTSRVSIAGMGLPLASVVFPISLSGMNHSATTWNFGDLLSRLVSEIPSATLYGLLAGDPVSVHQMMAHVGFALVSGVDIPPVSRPAIRTWSTNLVNELRRQLRDHGISSEILMDVDSSRRSAFVDELIRPLEPFIPELVDFFFRATSASRAAAFGTRSAEFLGTMARQFVTSFGEYLGGDAERINRVLRQLVVCLGMYENLAGFVVENFLLWAQASGATATAAAPPVSSTASRRRQRPANSSEPTIGPAAKRHRRP